MRRTEDWPRRLAALIAERRHAPFEWGRHDCALWAADAWHAQTGEDLGAPFRGRYSTALGALRALRRYGGVELPVHLADRSLGERLPIARARLGDVVAADLDALGVGDGGMGPALGVCYGRSSLFVGSAGSHDGLITLPTLQLEHCYNG